MMCIYAHIFIHTGMHVRCTHAFYNTRTHAPTMFVSRSFFDRLLGGSRRRDPHTVEPVGPILGTVPKARIMIYGPLVTPPQSVLRWNVPTCVCV